jgi:hypothetical protein
MVAPTYRLRLGQLILAPCIAVLYGLSLDLLFTGSRPRRQVSQQLGVVDVSPVRRTLGIPFLSFA